MKRIIMVLILVLILFVLVACNPSESVIQTAIAQTQVALPTITLTNTAKPILLSLPTSTLFPTSKPLNTALPQYQKTYDSLLVDIGKMLESATDIDSVTTIRPGKDSLEIELKVKWASKDRQPNASFEVIKLLAIVFGNTDEGKALNFVTGSPTHFSIFLTTYSADGDYKYSSLTYYDTLVKLYNKQITYDEWVSESGAGFVP